MIIKMRYSVNPQDLDLKEFAFGKCFSNDSLEKFVNLEVAQCLANNSERLNKSKISVIHPDIYLKYSSVNLFVGRQGRGKTLTINKEMVKLSKIYSDPLCGSEHAHDVHMLVFVNKDGRVDDTTEALKELISIPIKYVSVKNIEEYLKELYFHKLIYQKIVDEGLEDELEDDQINEVKQFLFVNDFSRQSLQEVILFDDAAFENVLKKSDSVIVAMAHQARHYKFIFCFCVQGIKDVPLPIKEQTTTFFLYSGFMKQKLYTIYSQCGIRGIEFDDFKRIYDSLGEKDYLIIDCASGKFKICDDADLTPIILFFKNKSFDL